MGPGRGVGRRGVTGASRQLLFFVGGRGLERLEDYRQVQMAFTDFFRAGGPDPKPSAAPSPK